MDIMGLADEISGMYVVMSPLTLSCAKNLLNKAENTDDNVDATCMSMAAIIISLNAIDTFLTDYAYHFKREFFSNNFASKGIRYKYYRLFNKELENEFPEVEKLRKARGSLVHLKPHDEKALQLGKVTNCDFARWAVETSENFIATLLSCPGAKFTHEFSFKNY